jgi:hypothetical protein
VVERHGFSCNAALRRCDDPSDKISGCVSDVVAYGRVAAMIYSQLCRETGELRAHHDARNPFSVIGRAHDGMLLN